MDKGTKLGAYIIIAFIVIVLAVGVCAYFVGRADTANSRRAGDYQSAERAMLTGIGDGIGRAEEGIDVSIECLGRIEESIRIYQEKLGTIRGLDRRSSDLYAAIGEECDYMESCINSISSILDSYHNRSSE